MSPIEKDTGPHYVHVDQLYSVQWRIEAAPTAEDRYNLENRTYVVKRPLSGGPLKDVARIAPANPAAYLTVNSLWVDEEGVTLSTLETKEKVWEHRLVRFKP